MLRGIVVAEFGRIFSAPLAGMILSDLGARVIKIERKGTGDESRHYGAKIADGISDYFFALNRKKEIIQLDLKNKDDLHAAYNLLSESDVLIHNSLQRSFDALGMSYEKINKLNPRIIYAAISGYGAGSKYKNTPSQDVTIQGLGGFMSLNGLSHETPVKTGVPVIDYVTGQNAVIGILAALMEREKTGKGCMVTTSLLESSISMTSVEAARYLNTGAIAGRHGNRHHSIAPYNSYKTLDGHIIIAIANDEMFERFARAIGIDPSGFEKNQQRLCRVEELEKIINERTGKFAACELVALLKEHKVSCGPINNIAQALESEEVRELGIVEHEGGLKYIRTPINFAANESTNKASSGAVNNAEPVQI